jgi:hypothetical protein
VFAQAIRPPTVPAGTARLRLAAMATHTAGELRWAARELAAAARETGADPRGASVPKGNASELFLYDAERDEPAFERAA